MNNKRIRKVEKTAVEVESARLKEYIDYINDMKIKEVQINGEHYFESDLSFVLACPSLTHIYIVSSIIEDYSHLYQMKALRGLSTEEPLGELDFSLLPNLMELHITWNRRVKNIGRCRSLKGLSITKYKARNRNLEELSSLAGLERLALIQPNIISTSRIQSLKHLHRLELSHARALENFTGTEELSRSLKGLELTNCPNIKQYESLGEIGSLEKLIIDRCADLSSLKFIGRLSSLNFFVFLETDVKDGDLSPCERIDYVMFTDKKHFSHSKKDFLR